MSELALVVKVGGRIIKGLGSMLDLNHRRALEQEIENYALAEFPRIHRLLEERVDEVSASGCSVHEANIIAHQVFEAQKRTLDDDKRRRLSNVLVNGLCAPEWDMARHRLLVRLTAELEEEHIDRLRREVRTPQEIHAETERIRREIRTPESQREYERKHMALEPVRAGIARELVSRELLKEQTEQVRNPSWKEPKPPEYDLRTGKPKNYYPAHLLGTKRVPEFVDRTSVKISRLGRMLLEHLRDPEAAKSDKTAARGRKTPAR